MEFDWNSLPFNLESSLTQREIEESFEDPFALRQQPQSKRIFERFFYLPLRQRTFEVERQTVPIKLHNGPRCKLMAHAMSLHCIYALANRLSNNFIGFNQKSWPPIASVAALQRNLTGVTLCRRLTSRRPRHS